MITGISGLTESSNGGNFIYKTHQVTCFPETKKSKLLHYRAKFKLFVNLTFINCIF